MNTSFPAKANFPGAQWDGSSADRNATVDGEPVGAVYRGCSPNDYAQISAEVQAMQAQLGAGGVASLSATTGFIFLPKVSGTPTGVPANVPAGFVAALYDVTAHKVWVYDGGWKATAALA